MSGFFKSFRYAWEGIVHGSKTERNFRFHLCAMTLVIIASVWTGLTKMEWFVVVLLIGGVLALELINTAVERVVDLVTSERHPLAKQAKDLVAGAVLIYAIISAIIGLFIFIPKWFF